MFVSERANFQDRIDRERRKARMRLLGRSAIFFIHQNRFRLYARALDNRPPAHFAGYTLDFIAIIPGIHTPPLRSP